MITLVDGDLYQWDTGRVVLIEPENGYIIHEVHFATRKMDFAYVAKTYEENGNTYCKIPNILLQQYYDIYCYEVRENDDGEESTSTTIFKVIKRNRPLDYIYTDPEKYTYKEIENRLKALEDELADVKAITDEVSSLANNAYAMAETTKSTVDTFEERITSIEEQPSASNNVVEF